MLLCRRKGTQDVCKRWWNKNSIVFALLLDVMGETAGEDDTADENELLSDGTSDPILENKGVERNIR